MKKAKIKATKDYHDTELDRLIKIGEETIVSLERAEKITGLNYAVLVETIEEVKDEPITVQETKPAPKKRTGKKKK